MKIAEGHKVLFIGDSITDAERERPSRYSHAEGLGTGYVALVNAMIQSAWPERGILVMNAGISGNQVTDLEQRWEHDVLEMKPDWLSIMIGINDVWRQFDNPNGDNLVPKPMFHSILSDLVERSLPVARGGLVLMTPFLIEPDTSDPMRVLMDAYGGVVKDIAGKAGAVFVDTQSAFDRYLQHRPGTDLCSDRIHPNLTGHLLLARAFADALEV